MADSWKNWFLVGALLKALYLIMLIFAYVGALKNYDNSPPEFFAF